MTDEDFTLGLANYIDDNPQFSPSPGSSIDEINQALALAVCSYTKTIPRDRWPISLEEDYVKGGGTMCSALGITL